MTRSDMTHLPRMVEIETNLKQNTLQYNDELLGLKDHNTTALEIMTHDLTLPASLTTQDLLSIAFMEEFSITV